MSLSKDTLAAIIKAYKGNDLAGFLHKTMEQVRTIKAQVRSIDKDEETEKDRHKRALSDISAMRKKVRDECSHWETTYYPDPSGNNDSSTSCDICGRELSRAERNKWIQTVQAEQSNA
jgi:hypothetical protein